jgi:hypothetical protein
MERFFLGGGSHTQLLGIYGNFVFFFSLIRVDLPLTPRK